MPNIDSVFSMDSEKSAKMNNKRLDYHWSLLKPTPISKELNLVQLTNNVSQIVLGHTPFKLWGKFFNIREPGSKAVRQYSLVFHYQPMIKRVTLKIIQKFLEWVPKYASIESLQKILKAYQAEDSYPIVEDEEIVIENQPNELTLLIRKQGRSSARKMSSLLTGYKPKAGVNVKFSLRGPWGRGLELNRNTSGHVLIFGMGTGCLPFIDLLQFIVRKLINKTLNKQKIPKKKIALLDAFNEN